MLLVRYSYNVHGEGHLYQKDYDRITQELLPNLRRGVMTEEVQGDTIRLLGYLLGINKGK